MWTEIQRLLTHHGVDHAILTPWFTIHENQIHNWSLPLMYGDKGLIPAELPKRLRQHNRDVKKTTMTRAIQDMTDYVRWCIRTIYSNRMIAIEQIKHEVGEEGHSEPPQQKSQDLRWHAPATDPRSTFRPYSSSA